MPVEFPPPPDRENEWFTCPYCGLEDNHEWRRLKWQNFRNLGGTIASKCRRCDNYLIWKDGTLIYPNIIPGPDPHERMPEDVKRDYEEARLVVDDSPRSAAALLRLAIQRMVEDHLDEEDDSLYKIIGNLVAGGRISSRTQKALDSVRVIGNNAVHPGEMDMDDDRETANKLFNLVNLIVEETVGREQMVNDVFDSLPEGPKDGINQRDTR